jgi:hypothetical protein
VHQVGFYYTDTQRIFYRHSGTTYQPHLQGSRIVKDRTDRFSRNDVKELPLFAASFSRRTQNSSTSRRSPEITQGRQCSECDLKLPSQFVPGQTAQILLSADGCNVYIVFTLQLPTHLLCYGVDYQGFHFRQGQQIILFSHPLFQTSSGDHPFS